MTFSPANGHLFIRSRVCCSCGECKDVESCGRGAPKEVLVQTGPSASDTPQLGVCSGGCEGSVADTIGVVEFDTVSRKFVAEHAYPATSPDGEYILLLPNDGGKNVRVLKTGDNGAASVSINSIIYKCWRYKDISSIPLLTFTTLLQFLLLLTIRHRTS